MRGTIAAGLYAFLVVSLPGREAAAQEPPRAAAAAEAVEPPPSRAARPGERGVYCPRLLDVTTREVCDDVNVRVDQLQRGTGRLAPPNPVFRDSPVTVYFEVARPGTGSRLQEGTQIRDYGNVLLSRYMSAVLVGEGFRIDPAPPPGRQNGGEPRQFGLGDNMMWRWNVTALDAPRHHLRIEVYVHIPVKNKDGSDEYTVTPVLSQSVEIPVRRTLGQRFEDAGRWLSGTTTAVKLVTALLVALGALLTAWFSLPGLRRRVRKTRAAPSPPGRRKPRGKPVS